jgi:hemolysin III
MTTVATTAAMNGKPRLRGISHIYAALPALVAALLLAQRPESASLRVGVLIYGTTLVLLFAVSGLYHTPDWSPATRMKLRRLDRSMIYLFVAGGFTPFFLLLETEQTWVLPVVWGGALLGCLKSLCFPKAPRALTAVLYVLLGMLAVPFFPALLAQLGTTTTALIVAGGVAYISGAICYARKGPNLVAGVFGYHELFHLLVIIGAGLHYAGVWIVVGR